MASENGIDFNNQPIPYAANTDEATIAAGFVTVYRQTRNYYAATSTVNAQVYCFWQRSVNEYTLYFASASPFTVRDARVTDSAVFEVDPVRNYSSEYNLYYGKAFMYERGMPNSTFSIPMYTSLYDGLNDLRIYLDLQPGPIIPSGSPSYDKDSFLSGLALGRQAIAWGPRGTKTHILGVKNISNSGVYFANSDGFDGYSQVNVNLGLASKIITANGTYYATGSIKGFNRVDVDIPLGAKTIQSNGIYNASGDSFAGYSQVNVNLPLGTKTISSNGIYLSSNDSLEGYNQVVVNVAGGSGSGTGIIVPKAINNNGTYNAASESVDGYNPIIVSVPSAEVYCGTAEPSSSLGVDGDIYYRKYFASPAAGLNTIIVNITRALRGSNVLTYAGAQQIHVIFDDGNGNEVSMQSLSDFSYSATATSTGGTVSRAFDGNLSTYWEAWNTPITLTINATIPSGYTPKRLEVYQRTGTYNTDVWSTFTVNYVASNGTFPILSEENLTTADWAGAGNWTLFDFINSTVITEEVYIKNNGEWETTDKIEFDDPFLELKTISSNGVYLAADDEVDGYNIVNVNLPFGQKIITQNGIYTSASDSYAAYNEIIVNVPATGQYESLTITENGTYTPSFGYDAISDVTVNVNTSSDLAPIATNFSGGYASKGIWYTNSSTYVSDIYQVNKSSIYSINLDTIPGDTFRAIWTESNPAQASSSITGIMINADSSNPSPNSNKTFMATSSGYITITKSTNSETNIKTRVTKVFEDNQIALPSEYQQVEYLSKTDYQYITVSFTFQKNDIIICETQALQTPSDEGSFFGDTSKIEFYYSTSNELSVWFNGPTYNQLGISKDYSLNRKGQILISISNSVPSSTNWNFGTYRSGRYPFNGYIYFFKFFRKINDTYTKVLELIPCYRKLDNKPGFYDTLNSNFFTNQYSGTDFGIGPDIT